MSSKTPTAATALKRLKAGNKRFSTDKPVHERHDAGARSKLVDGQSPFACILSCADSRVIPELIFDVGLGEIFVVRVAGNTANTCSVASLEYAVLHLNVNLVVVLGHQNCGAVTAAMNGGDNGRHLNSLVSHITPAVGKARGKDDDAKLKSAIKWNAKLTATELERCSPAMQRKTLDIVPAYYNLGSGKVEFL